MEPPGIINKFQFITSFFFNKCHSPWTLWVDSAVPATVELSRSILMLDLFQVTRTAFRPRGNRQARHGGKEQGKRGKGGVGVPDIWDMVGQRLKSDGVLPAFEHSDKTQALWGILDTGEKWAGRLFILHITEEWLFKEALLVNVGSGMSCDFPAVRAEGNGPAVQGVGRAGAITGTHEIWHTDGATHFAGVTNIPGPRWFITVGCTVTNVGDGLGGDDPLTIGIGLKDTTAADQKKIWSFTSVNFMEAKELVCSAFMDSRVDGSSSRTLVWCPPQSSTSRCSVTDVVIYAQAY